MGRSVLVSLALCVCLLARCGDSDRPAAESFPPASPDTISVEPRVVNAGDLLEVTLRPDSSSPVLAPGLTFTGSSGSDPVVLVVRAGPGGPLLADLGDQVAVGESLPKIALEAPGPYSFRVPPGAGGKAKVCATVTNGVEEQARSELACEEITIAS